MTRKSPRARIGYIGWLGHRNLGDEAMFRTAAEHLDITPWWVRSRVQRVLRKLSKFKARLAGVCLGGGTLIFGDGTTFFEAMDSGLPVWTFGTGVKDVQFWQSWSGWDGKCREWCERLRQCARVTVRGPRSQEMLRQFGVESTVVGDPALLFCRSSIPSRPERPILGLNIGKCNAMELAREEDRVQTEVCRAVEILKSKGWHIRLYCVYPGDAALVRAVAEQLDVGRDSVRFVYTDPHAYMAAVEDCSVFLGFKLHATMLAFCANVPAVAIEYQPKVRDFMASVACEERCLPPNTLDGTSLAELLQQTCCNGEEIQEKQLNAGTVMKNRLLELTDWMNSI